MKLTIADTAGFCMGVDLALRKLDLALHEPRPIGTIFTLGPIIHNPQVLEHYARFGVRCAKSPDEAGAEDLVVIRAHGVPRHIQKTLEQRQVRLIDATCPKVKKAQIVIQKQAEQDRHLLLFGEPNHPEVQGLISYAHEYTIFETLEELQTLAVNPAKKYCLAAQTTQDKDQFDAITTYLKSTLDSKLPILDTICTATKERQDEVRRIAQNVQAMVIVGGKNSGNTRRLAQIATEAGIYAVHVETAAELPLAELTQYKNLGLTAGASTPAEIITQVAQALTTLKKER